MFLWTLQSSISIYIFIPITILHIFILSSSSTTAAFWFKSGVLLGFVPVFGSRRLLVQIPLSPILRGVCYGIGSDDSMQPLPVAEWWGDPDWGLNDFGGKPFGISPRFYCLAEDPPHLTHNHDFPLILLTAESTRTPLIRALSAPLQDWWKQYWN